MKKIRVAVNTVMFGICAAAGGIGLMNAKPVLAAENDGEEMVVSNVDADDGAEADVDTTSELSENSWGGVSKSGNTAEDENLGVYDFKDNKTAGTVTVTKVWDDDKTNEEREIPDIKISTAKPSKSALGYTVTFHGNRDAGLVFDDESDVNEVVYNSSGQIVDGVFKVPGGVAAGAVSWFTDEALTNKVDVNEDGTVQMALSGDVDLWGKMKTVEIKGYKQGVKNNNEFNALIPDTVTEILFTDEIKPESASVIDVDADGDGGAVAWTENDGAIMKVSTQVKGVKVQAAKNSEYMFYKENKLTNIDLSMLDTQSVTNMGSMFSNCAGLTSLDLSPLDTSNVTNMSWMFFDCSSLTSLDLSPLNASNATNMNYMFTYCKNIKELDCSKMDAKNVTSAVNMFSNCKALSNLKLPVFSEKLIAINSENHYVYVNDNNYSYGRYVYSMFDNCSGLTSLDLTGLNISNVKNMSHMFCFCNSLTSLDLTPLDTSNVTDMSEMFIKCDNLTSINLAPLDTSNVTDMSGMFYGCSGLTNLDLTPLDTSNVKNMKCMFYDCSGLTTLDLSPLNTQNVTDMGYMFSGCSGLTTLTTGQNFKFVGTNYRLDGTWQNTAGETFNGNNGTANFPSNIADTYTKISS